MYDPLVRQHAGHSDQNAASASSLLRLRDIIGQKAVTTEEAVANQRAGIGPRRPRQEIRPLIAVSASTWWAWCAQKIAPPPIRLSGGVTVWRACDVLALMQARTHESFSQSAQFNVEAKDNKSKGPEVWKQRLLERNRGHR